MEGYTDVVRMDMTYQEYRCSHCHKLLLKGVLVEAQIEVMCKACKECTTIKKSTLNTLICMIENCPNRIHCPSAQQ